MDPATPPESGPDPLATPLGRRVEACLTAADWARPPTGCTVPAGLADRTAERLGRLIAAEREAQPAFDAWIDAAADRGAAPAAAAPLAGLLDAADQAGDEVNGPAADLVARTLAGVEADRRAAAVTAHLDRFRGPAEPAPDPAVAGRIGPRGAWRGGLRQALTAAAVVAVGSALLLPALRQSSTEAGRLACLGNLRAAGGAFARYAADFGGVLPRTAGFSGLSLGELLPLAARRGGGGNGENLALLTTAAGGYLPPERLVCHGQPAASAEGDARLAWQMPGSSAYSYQSQAGPEPLRLDAARADLGVLADRNPLFGLASGSAPSVGGPSPMTPSRVHRGAGQNVLTAAGDARWTVRPRLGVSRLAGGPAKDRLWTAEGPAAHRWIPTHVAQDSVLLP